MSCTRCDIAVRAEFPALPLSNLPVEHQRFIEMFVLASGNLKEIAALAGVSYPTVRNRLDKVIDALRRAITESNDHPASLDGTKSPAAREMPADPATILKNI